MSLTVNQLLRNHVRGISSNVHNYDIDAYFDMEIPRFDDINDIKEYKDELRRRAKELEEQIREEKEQKKKDADLLNKSDTPTPDKDE